jgi:tetratricopeptide (TPR) repeat protein
MNDARQHAALRRQGGQTALAARASAGAVAVAAWLASTAACGASNNNANTAGPPSKASPEQRSTAEYDLAREAFQSGRLREALQHVQTAIKLNEDNADADYLGSVVMLNFCAQSEQSSDCRYNEAEDYARKTLKVAPEHRDAKNTLGVILIHEKRYEDAIGVLKPLANDILYNSPEKSWGNLGWAYYERGNIDEAIDALRRAVAAQPLFCVGYYRLGLAYEKKGESNLARESLTHAVEVKQPACQGLQDAFFARGRIERKLGLRDEAQRDFEHCRDLAQTTPVGHRCAAELGSGGT